MNKPTQRQPYFGTFVILLVLGGGAFYALRFLTGIFAPLDSQVAIVIGIAALVVVLSAALIASAIKQMQRAERADLIRGECAALYDRTLKALRVLPLTKHPVPDETPECLHADLLALENVLGLIASPEVLRAYLAFRIANGARPCQSGQLRTHLSQLMLAMRRDLAVGAPASDERELLSALLGEAKPPVDLVQEQGASELAPIASDLRPRVSLVGPK